MERKAIVKLKNVTVLRNGKKLLNDISLSVYKGECLAVIGPNGAGKSTLISVICGYMWPTHGSVEVLGQKYGEVDLHEVRESIGLIEPTRTPQCKEWLTVRDAVATGITGGVMLYDRQEIRPSDWEKVDRELDAVNLSKKKGAIIEELSIGEKKRVLIARTMVSKPKLLVLDEPTSALDMGARIAFLKSLEKLLERRNAPGLIVVSHRLDELPHPVHQVVLLKSGRVMDHGQPEKTLTSKNLSRVFDCPVNLIHEDGRYSTQIKQEGLVTLISPNRFDVQGINK